jgi:hypothetical protein
LISLEFPKSLISLGFLLLRFLPFQAEYVYRVKFTQGITKMTNKTLITAQRETLKNLMAKVREQRAYVKFLVADMKNERVLTKIVREDAKRLRAEKIAAKKAAVEQKTTERVARLTAKAAEQKARLEARLAALEAKMLKAKGPKAVRKAAKKPSKVTFISKESVAA